MQASRQGVVRDYGIEVLASRIFGVSLHKEDVLFPVFCGF